MIVLDTHAWVWWVSDPERLSARAREAVDQAAKEGGTLHLIDQRMRGSTFSRAGQVAARHGCLGVDTVKRCFFEFCAGEQPDCFALSSVAEAAPC